MSRGISVGQINRVGEDGTGLSHFCSFMRKRKHLVVGGICGATIFLIGWQAFYSRDLIYRGKSVSSWVEIYSRNGTNAHLHFRAVCNLIDLGTNAWPSILRVAATRDNALKKLLLKVPMPDKLLDKFKFKESYKRWADAAALRPPMAAGAFLLMGRDNRFAVPSLIELLSSDNPFTRAAAADMLRAVGPAAQKSLPALILLSIRDPDPAVRSAAERAVKAIKVSEATTHPLIRPTDDRNALPFL